MTRSRVAGPLAAALPAVVLAVALAGTAACTPPGTLTGADASAEAPVPLSTPAAPVGASVVLGTGIAPATPTAPAPAATVTERAVQFVTVTRAPTPTATTTTPDLTSTCDPLQTRRIVLGIRAVPGPGTARVTFHSRKGASLRGWRVAAVRQDLRGDVVPDVVWTDVAAPEGCQDVGATVTGLVRGGRYEFWLHAMLSTVRDPGPTAELVGRSAPVDIP